MFDGTNASDYRDYRPGDKAKGEFNIRSPLKEAGINKSELRQLSRMEGLPFWNKPAGVCLASRLPFGEKITMKKLLRIAAAERVLTNSGFREVRVRDYGRLCRIEVPEKMLKRLISKRKTLVNKLKRLGYNYITADMQGYRAGSMNELLKY